MTASLFATPEACVARVALPVPIDRLFDYAVPASQAAQVRPGCRALVPFRERLLTGVIVERTGAAEFEGTLRSIERVLDAEPVLSEAMLGMLRDAADDCLCPIGIAMATALPPGSAPRLVAAFALTPRGRAALDSGALSGAAGRIALRLADGPRGEAALREREPDPAALGALLESLLRDGLVARVRMERAPSARVAVRRFARLAPGVDVARAREELRRAPRQAELLLHLARGEVRTDALGPHFDGRLLRELVARGLATLCTREVPRDVFGDPAPRDTLPELTGDQASALKPICDAVRARRAESFLLHGVTGSGKTEVYLRAVAEALALGRQALVLVPEITLTHQIVARLRARFGDRLAVLHSGLRPGERLEQWQRLRGGDTPIAVGARSALFAPLCDVGVIVIDEEHDGAYKNEEGLHYHARTLAAKRAAIEGCPLVLGSATPSLESRFAADHGEMQRLVLSRRIGGRPLPAVEIVDLAKERARAPRGRKVVLSVPLRAAMAETLAGGGQTILFLNRRGFSTQVFCFDCGHAERCPHCDIALVYHAAANRLRCHYCDHSAPPPRVCGGCGAPDTALLGLGTERLVEEVRTHFRSARIARLDRDTAARRGHTQQVLRDLQAGRLDVLVGTQMVAKGHDFPGVRLVGVVAADIGLHMPDFRAAERTFQLLTQVAGRAGRDAAPGRVIVQTFVPSHYAIRPVRDHDFESFYAEELLHRASLGFPPFGRVAHVVVSAEQEATAQQGAARLAHSVAGARGCETLGPAPAPLAKLRDRYRYQLLLKGDAASVHAAARLVLAAAEALPEAVQTGVDVDPVHML
jgi:primosomal protein N' (replication factor Y)